jgi:hypothetical protein
MSDLLNEQARHHQRVVNRARNIRRIRMNRILNEGAQMSPYEQEKMREYERFRGTRNVEAGLFSEIGGGWTGLSGLPYLGKGMESWLAMQQGFANMDNINELECAVIQAATAYRQAAAKAKEMQESQQHTATGLMMQLHQVESLKAMLFYAVDRLSESSTDNSASFTEQDAATIESILHGDSVVTGRIAKITRIDGKGLESAPIDVPLTDKITFPPSDGNEVWRIYLPLHGFEATGAWYFWNAVTESYFAPRPDRTLRVSYRDSDLVDTQSPPEYAPPLPEAFVSVLGQLTSPAPNFIANGDNYICGSCNATVPATKQALRLHHQEHVHGTDSQWTCNEHNTPITYTLGQSKCEVCGREKE